MSTIDYVRKLGFLNVQDYINSEAFGTINNERLNKMLTFMFKNGWVEIPKVNGLFDFSFQPRDLIKYVTNEKPKEGGIRNIVNVNLDIDEVAVYGSSANKFRSGGWLISIDDADEGGKYILYKPHNLSQPPIPVQFENIGRLFVLSTNVQEEARSKRPVTFKRPGVKTNYPVCMQDENDNTVTVYYGKDEYARKQFMSTPKFKRATNNGWTFI